MVDNEHAQVRASSVVGDFVQTRYFTVDARWLAAFRVGFGALLTWDCARRFEDARAYYYIGLSHEYQVPPLDKKYQDAVVEYNANRTADQIIVSELKEKVVATLKVVDDKLTEAIEALAKSVAIGGVPEARPELEKLYKGKNNSTQGLDDLIQQMKASLG